MVKEVVFSLQGARAGYTDTPLFTDVDMFLHRGDCYTLVGRNGTGKSTLFNVIQDTLEIEKGERFTLDPLTIARLDQEPVRQTTGTALDYALSQGDMEIYRAEQLLHALGVDADMPASALSGGQLRRAGLAGCFAQEPDILLLDEPTNHLDLPTVEWLEKEIKAFKGTIVVISHDRRFLSNISNGILWLEDKRIRFLNKSFAFFEEWQDAVYEEEEKRFNKLQTYIKQEERYALRGVTARRKRNQRRVERLQSLRMERLQRRNQDTAILSASENKVASKMVFEAKDICKTYDNKVICDNFSMRVLRGDTIGILGGNGTGKSTLVKMLLKEEPIDSGRIRKAKQLNIVYFDQYREQLDPKSTPWEMLGNGGDYITVGGKEMHVVGYLKRFLFDHEDAKARISTFSGGQKNRLLLAKILAQPSDVMVLDEPTNDLDMDTLDLLEDMLSEYKGTLMIVSHDRDFLDRLVGCLYVMEGQGAIKEVIGGWEDYLRIRNANAPANNTGKDSKEKNTKKSTGKNADKSISTTLRLSPKEQHALKQYPDEIEKMQETIVKLTKMLQDPNLYTDNPETFEKVTTALSTSQQAKEKMEETYIELLLKQEQVDALQEYKGTKK